MTSDPTTRPVWLHDLSTVCKQCQKPSAHLAFIEESNSKQTIIYDYHFCPQCKAYYKTKTTAENYTLFFNNTLKNRTVDPATGKAIQGTPFDPQYGATV